MISEDLLNLQSGRKRKADPLSFLPTLPAVSNVFKNQQS